LDRGAIAIAVLASVGCWGQQVTFEHLQHADRIEVTRHGVLTTTVRDPNVIGAVYAMVARHDSGWRTPSHGSPAPVLHVKFFRGSELLGGFGLGKDFLTSNPGPLFMMRTIPATETAELARMLQVPWN